MYVPMQREPVQRPLAGQPFVNQSKEWATPSCMRAGEYGVQPSQSWQSLLGSIATPILQNLGGALAGLF